MHTDLDLVILGGGCAGLSLATELAHLGGAGPHAVVLEGRQTYSHDRTWCFFKDGQAAPRTDVQHAWQSMRVASGAGSIAFDCGAARYEMVNAGQFYKNAQIITSQSANVDLKMGVVVIKPPEKQNDLWKIDTDGGTFYSRYVVDTRPAQRPHRDGAKLWQSFYGQEIACAEPIFETEYVDLMDFLEPRKEQIAFTYVLPLSPYRALIEATVFDADPLSRDALEAQLQAAIAQRLRGAAFSVVRSEHGILPMGMIPAAAVRSAPLSPLNRDLSYIKVGLTAGGARPATGYAFQRIQRWADLCASAIMAGKPLVTHPPDPLLLRMMDRLFLQVIRAHPALAPELFLLIFEKVDPKRLIRFLSDRGTFADYIAIIRALPPGPFLGQIVSRIRGAFGSHQDPRHS